MAANFEYNRDSGAETGSPPRGTTRETAVADNNWSSNADPSQAYSTNPIAAGANSYSEFEFGKFTGTFNQISAGLWAHTLTAFGAGLTLKGKVQSLYTLPATTTDSGMSSPTDMTTAIGIGSGATVLFHTAGPEGAGPSTSIAAAGYSQYLTTQLQTTTGAAAGDTATVTLTLRYNEN